ncbi:hypothetical protein L484_008054 [Morus notabilis]|uniref:Uncharacterized protein n=1 Tax=Morus notabilis TaxID=981085 RepID=W9QRZ2_9ROSA|nr:hypothetical protein L484_008054 [Morus notabilis]
MREATKTRTLDPLQWQAFASWMGRVILKVFYFPYGHTKHAFTTADFSASHRVLLLVICPIFTIKSMPNL